MEKGKRKMALGVESDHVELREGDKRTPRESTGGASSQCKGPEVELHLAGLRSSKVLGREVGDAQRGRAGHVGPCGPR